MILCGRWFRNLQFIIVFYLPWHEKCLRGEEPQHLNKADGVSGRWLPLLCKLVHSSSTELSHRASALQSTSEFGFSFEAVLKLGVCYVMACLTLERGFF